MWSAGLKDSISLEVYGNLCMYNPVCIAERKYDISRFIESGGVYKLAFGPKAFVVVSDPVVVRHLLKVRKSAHLYRPFDSRGMLDQHL